MSNRVLGILIILGFMGAGYIYYHLIYIPDQLSEEKVKQEEIQVAIEKEKQPKLVPLENTIEVVASATGISNAEKIEELKKKNNAYFHLSLGELGDIKFVENNNKLDLFLEDEYLGDFQKVDKGEIGVQGIINNPDYLFLVLGEDRFLYSLNNKTITNIELNVQVEYVKVGKDTSEFLFKTPVGIFAYSLIRETIEYIHFFKDFVYFIDDNTGKYGYIGVIHNFEEKKLKDLGFNVLVSGDSFQSLVVFYSPISKEKKVLLESDLSISNIYTLDSETGVDVFIVDESRKKYRVENI